MRRSLFFTLFLIGALAVASLFCVFDDPPRPTAQEVTPRESLGTIQREESLVRYGPSLNQLREVATTENLLSESALEVTDGGEALLDFDFGLLVRAFNNADMDVVIDPGDSSLLGEFFLRRSVITGELVAQGEETQWRTPNGQLITISGTEFWIGYDDNPDSEETIVGNFNGTVDIDGYGSLPSGRGVILPSGTEFDITVTRIQFERAMRGAGDPRAEMWNYAAPAPQAMIVYGGEPFAPQDMRDAMLYAVPWQELLVELTGNEEAEIFVTSGFRGDDPVPVTRFPYDQERAYALFQEYGYQPSGGEDVWLPLPFALIVPEMEPYLDVGENATGYYENFGFGVEFVVVPPGDFYPIVQTALEAGESFWAIGPPP